MMNDDDQKNNPEDNPNDCPKDDWDEMASLWQKQDVEMPKDLPKKIRRKTLQMYIIFGSEALVTICGIIAGFWIIFTKGEKFSPNFGYFIIIMSILAIGISWWIRRGIWQSKSSSTIDQVELSIKRAKASVVYSNYNLWSTPPLILFMSYILWQRYDEFLTRYNDGETQLLWIFVFVVTFITVITIGSWVYKRKKQQELSFFTELLKQMKVEEK